MTAKPASRWETQLEQRPEAKVEAVVRELRRAGGKILSMTGGDPPRWGWGNQPLSKYLIEAAEQGYHSYHGKVNDQGQEESPPLLTQLQNAIADFEKRERGIDLTPGNIIIGGGCASAILTVHMALLEEGDEVVTFEPAHYLVGPTSYFPYYKAKVVPCETIEEEGWRPDLDALREKITERTKMIVVNNPNNPTGAIYDEKTLKEIVNIAGEHDLPILGDEIYSFLAFDGVEAKSIATVAGDVPVIVVDGLAKIFMRTGWKVGFAAFHDPAGKIKDLISAANKVWRLYGGSRRSMATPMLYAAIRTFQGSIEAGRELVQGVKKIRDYSMKRVNEIDGLSCVKPKGTFYLFPRIEATGVGKTWESDIDFLIELAKEKHLTFNPGSQYGEYGSGHFRSITLPKIEILKDVFNRLDEFMTKHAN